MESLDLPWRIPDFLLILVLMHLSLQIHDHNPFKDQLMAGSPVNSLESKALLRRIMGLSINDSVYSCLFFFLTGLHFFHLLFGIFLCCLLFWSCSFSFLSLPLRISVERLIQRIILISSGPVHQWNQGCNVGRWELFSIHMTFPATVVTCSNFFRLFSNLERSTVYWFLVYWPFHR